MRIVLRAICLSAVAVTAILAAISLPPENPSAVRSRPPAPTAEEEAGWASPLPDSALPAPRVQEAVPPRTHPGDASAPARRVIPSDVGDAAPARSGTAPQEGFSITVLPRPVRIEAMHGRAEVEESGPDAGRGQETAPVEVAQGDAPDRRPVLTPPVLLSPAVQDYPTAAYRLARDRDALTPQLRVDAAEGRVVLRVLVRTDGSVARAQVAESAGIPALDEAALHAAVGWIFAPATRDGEPIESWALIPVRFVVR